MFLVLPGPSRFYCSRARSFSEVTYSGKPQHADHLAAGSTEKSGGLWKYYLSVIQWRIVSFRKRTVPLVYEKCYYLKKHDCSQSRP